MKRWSTTSWIFMAVGYASGDGPATLEEVIAQADAINKAIPTQKELQRAFGCLKARDLMSKEGKRYQLTDKGKSLFNAARSNRTKLFDVWDYLTIELPDKGDELPDSEPSLEQLKSADETYRKKFWKMYRDLENKEKG